MRSKMDKYHNFYLSQRNPSVIVLGSSAALYPNFYSDKIKFPEQMKGVSSEDYLDARFLNQVLGARTGSAIKAVNLAMNGAMASDGWLISKKAIEFGKSPRFIIYEMTSRDFFDASMPEVGRTPVFSKISYLHPKGSFACLPRQVVEMADWAWSSPLVTSLSTVALDARFITDAERFQCSFDSVAAAVSYAYKARGDWRKWITNRACALFNRPSSVYESARLALEERKRKDPFGSLSKVKSGLIEVDSRPQVRRFEDEIHFFERLLKLCKEEGIVLIAIDMPMGATYAAKVPPALKDRYPSEISSLCKTYGAKYWNFNQPGWFTANDFRDFIHLGENGSVKFTELVGAKIGKERCIGANRTDAGK